MSLIDSSQKHSHQVKAFYRDYQDPIFSKRYNSAFWLRRYAHRTIYQRTLDCILPGQKVLDVGCGEGTLSILMAQKGARVTGLDISDPNIASASKRGKELALPVRFVVSDADQLPFSDNAFDIVVSSHVLEHLPDPDKGLEELHRVTKDYAIIAMPSCLNPSSWALLGGANYWMLSKRSLIGIPLGFLRTLKAYVSGDAGPQEGYAGKDLPHVFRFPRVVKRMITKPGFRIERYTADTLLIPYLAEYFSSPRKIQPILDRLFHKTPFKYLGMGSHVLCRKISD